MNESVGRRSFAAGALVLAVAVVVLAGCSSSGNPAAVGTYLNKGVGAIVLSADGRFAIVQANKSVATGTYQVDGTTITFTIAGQKPVSGKIEGDKLTDPDGNVFTKVAGTPTNPST